MGCRPKHWKFIGDKPYCKNKDQMKNFEEQVRIWKINRLDPPCKTITQLDYIYEEFDEVPEKYNL